MTTFKSDDELRRLGLEHLASPPAGDTEGTQRWRRYLSQAGPPATGPDSASQALADVTADPHDMAGYAAQREQLGLSQAGIIESQQIQGDSRQAAALLYEQAMTDPYQVAVREVTAEANNERADYAQRQRAAAQEIFGFKRPG